MSRLQATLVCLLLALGAPAPAQSLAPTHSAQKDQAPLAQLRQRFGGDCQLQDINTWTHPVLAVIAQRPQASLHWALLCRNAFYPVLGMAFDYDPQGQTKDFFYPLYWGLLSANEFWPLSLVEVSTGLAIHLDRKDQDGLAIDYEELANWPKQ